MRRTWMRALLVALLVVSSTVCGLAFLHWLRWLPDAELSRVDQISSGLGPPIAVVSLIVAVGSWWAQRGSAPSWTVREQQDAICDHLAGRVGRLLAEEATRRDLHPPYLQPVGWSSGTGSGSIADLSGFFGGLAVSQLVILGSAGSGKSSMALRLAIDLLADAGHSRVPMIFSLSSWDRTQKMDIWLAETLRRDYPELGDARRFGKGAAACVVGRILPILDAFDEMSPGAQPSALRHLRDELAAGRPLVLISREAPFRAAVEQAGVTLARATEIQVQPLHARDAASYLVAGQHRGDDRWHDVIKRIEEKPRGGLARLLSSPLMIYLARTAYEDPRSDPSELITMTIPQARIALMDAFLPAVYSERAHRVDRSLRRYRPESAERWLRLLARRMAARDTAALTWWRLPELSPGAIVLLYAAVMLYALAFIGLRYGPIIGAVAAVVAGRAVGSIRAAPRPARVALRSGALVGGAVAGGASGIAAAAFWIPDGSLIVATLFGLTISLATVLLLNVVFASAQNDDVEMRNSLRDDRNVLLAVLAISLVSGLRSADQWGWWMGVQQFARSTIFLAIGLAAVHSGVPWLRFAWTRLVLAVTGRLPPRLLTFLEDAHRRGVLTRAGATYEFRHSTFLKYLSSEPAPHPPGGAGGALTE